MISTLPFGIEAIAVALTSQPANAQPVAKPEDVKWTTVTGTFDAAQMLPGKWAKVVDDPTASGGKAVAVRVGKGRANPLHSTNRLRPTVFSGPSVPAN